MDQETVPEYLDEETISYSTEFVEYFLPKICVPMPDIFKLPTNYPNKVKEALRSAFSVFWLNPAACANQVRVSLEYLMDHLSIPKIKEGTNGKIENLTLDARITLFSARDVAIGEQLMALKLLGNTASHEGIVSKNDLLDAFEIMEHTLKEVIDKPSAKVALLAQNLTAKHTKKKTPL